MTATYEQIEDEAHRRFDENPCTPLAHYIIEVVREGWVPVDPDLIAVQGVLRDKHPEIAAAWGNKTALWGGEYAEQAVLDAYKAGKAAQ
jgi:hypothetical protein